MTYNNDPRIKFFIFCIVFVVAGLSYLTKILSDNFLYKYLDSFKSKFVINILVGLHWITSAAIACFLPDYLIKYNFFKHIFEESEIWVCLATLCIFFIALIVVASILNLVFYRKAINENEISSENVTKKD